MIPSNGRHMNMYKNITKVQFSVDGQKLVGTLLYPKKLQSSNSAALCLHGWGSNETRYIPRVEPLVELGYICLTFSMRGHGKSEGDAKKLSRKDHFQDCKAAYDFLVAQEGVDPHRIGVMGSSYGGYMAALLSNEREIKWLALKAPANYQDDNFEVEYAHKAVHAARRYHYRSLVLGPKDNKAINAISHFKNDVLIVESENDEILPKVCLQNYANALPDKRKLTYKIIEGSDHSSSEEKWNQEFIHIIRDWFASKII